MKTEPTTPLETKPGFTDHNAYFGFPVWTWNLPAGYTCPGAKECLTFAQAYTGKILHGTEATFTCYAARMERYPAVRAKAWGNFMLVRNLNPKGVEEALEKLWPKNASHIRIHAGGDFFSQDYFDGWLQVARNHPQTLLWAFTKSIPFWIKRLGQIPANLTLTGSYGSKHDDLIWFLNLKSARIVKDRKEASRLKLKIDTDDKLAMTGPRNFALIQK